MADDGVIVLPNGTELRGKEGARQFAAKHAETDGKKQSVALTSLDALTEDRFLATLVMTNRDVAAAELLYSMDVGGVIEVRDGLCYEQPGLSFARRGCCRSAADRTLRDFASRRVALRSRYSVRSRPRVSRTTPALTCSTAT
jgi:hypothetical protein